MPWNPDYATVTELADFTDADEALESARLGLAVATASRAVDDATNRQFGKVAAPEERFYAGRWNRRRCRWWVPIDDLADAAGLVLEVAGVAVTAFTLEPVNALAEGKVYERLVFDPSAGTFPDGREPDVSVTASFGWPAVPDTIKEATLLQASRFFARRQSPYGIAGSPELGSEIRLLARADPDVAVAVRSFVRDRVKIG